VEGIWSIRKFWCDAPYGVIVYLAQETRVEDTSTLDAAVDVSEPELLESQEPGPDADVARQRSSSGTSQLLAADIAAGRRRRLIRTPGTMSSERAYVLPVMFFFISPRFLRDPATDRSETLPHDQNLAVFYKLTLKILGVLPQKSLGPKICKISVNFGPLQTLISNVSGTMMMMLLLFVMYYKFSTNCSHYQQHCLVI